MARPVAPARLAAVAAPGKMIVETERKFDASDGFALPDFTALDSVHAAGPSVVHELRATYYDTADLRLASAGVALRRRTGGSDAGWHLKLARTIDRRVEIQLPLGRLAPLRRLPPAQLRALVTAHTRGRRLRPTATLHTRRVVHQLLSADGAPLVEIADDHVTARLLVSGWRRAAQPRRWREIEAELVEGDTDVLDAVGDALHAAGATSSASGSKLHRALGSLVPARPPSIVDLGGDPTASDFVLAHLGEQARELRALDPLVRRDVPDALHQYRVAVRRLRAALATFRRLFDRAATEPLRAELWWLGRQMAPARDAEVVRERLLELVDAEPGELVRGPVRRRIATTMSKRRRAGQDAAVRVLDSPRYLQLLDRLDGVVSGGALRPERAQRGRKALRRALTEATKRWRKRLDALEQAMDGGAGERPAPELLDHRLHDVRKAARRARYAAESVAPVLGQPAEELADAMHDAQDILGGHQDATVAAQALSELAAHAAAAGEDTFTYGRLHASERAAGKQAAEEAMAVLRDLAKRTAHD